MTGSLDGAPSNEIFVGRDAVLRAVSERLARDRPVVVWGAGGIGKTALASRVARRQNQHFPAGVVWVDCRGSAWGMLLSRLSLFCGVGDLRQARAWEVETALRWALAGLGERCLLVLDDATGLEQSDRLLGFLDNLPVNCQALLTTRADPQQVTWSSVELQPLPDEAMAKLCLQHAAANKWRLEAPSRPDGIEQLLVHLRGVPLALSLVVPLVSEAGFAATARALEEVPGTGVEAAFALAYARLGGVERRLLARLSAFTEPFWPDAAEALMPDGEEIERALDTLRARALLDWDGSHFSFHPLLREYAYGKLQAEEDVRPVHRLAAEYLRDRVLDPDQHSAPGEALHEVDQWEWAGAWEIFAERACDLAGAIHQPGYRDEIGVRLERARAVLHKRSVAPRELKARVLTSLGTIAGEQLDWGRAADAFEQALDALEPLGVRHAIGQCLADLGLAYWRKPELDPSRRFQREMRATELLEQALAKLEDKDLRITARIYNELGMLSQFRLNEDDAIEQYERALDLAERIGDQEGMARAYSGLASAYRYKRDWARAVAFDEKALALQEALGDERGVARTLDHLGAVYRQKGDLDRALEYFEQAASTMERATNRDGLPRAYTDLNLAWQRTDTWDRAIDFYRQHLARSERAGDLRGVARACHNLGRIHCLKEEWARAVEFFAKDLALSTRAGDLRAMAGASERLTWACGQAGERERAFGFRKEFLALSERLGDLRAMVDTLCLLGSDYAERGNEQRAIECHERSLVIAEELGMRGRAARQGHLLSELHRKAGRIEEARLYSAQAVVALARQGSMGQISAFRHLVELCDSEEAAEAYVKAVADATPVPEQPSMG